MLYKYLCDYFKTRCKVLFGYDIIVKQIIRLVFH